jgi:hypothetical protein
MRLLIERILGHFRSSSEQPAAIVGLSAVDGENLTDIVSSYNKREEQVLSKRSLVSIIVCRAG